MSEALWFKSSYSNATGGDCLEVAPDFPGLVPLRDSKVPDGPVVLFRAPAWASFLDSLKG
ncbi:DUF397 domain-containing protein [Streptomyces anandii]|uniref:DUF397 domain-containing protein n=1 Tax=Streptomyces anandii TaxID=285454 RepID=UPI0027E4554B|nr:DUF397 domain-containing protein [Streptomyces anandii]